jgi:ketosteroid isomerase-like protein
MRDAAAALAHFYETLTPQSLARLGDFYAPDACFRDPFNDVHGLAAIERIFRHMFAEVEVPRFAVVTQIVDGQQAMLGWVFSFRRGGRSIEIRGVSHLRFDHRGRVCLHRDYWDAAEELYAKLPMIGVLMRALRRRLSAAG